ncbi:MAG: hypothetical protein GXO50_08145 [Chlorobi bacterium]|nr:hypothetical protein [Chlorobiota bacterium]
MEIYKKQITDIWLKAAVVGSLWGSIEIIAGSFFHNMRIPLSGTVLAVLGIILLVAFGRIWKDKGLFWRAGLIAAVMKSVSPSAVLIGPMTGILLEAVLFELSVTFLGRNVFAYIVGGIAALYSVIIHKLITLLIIYGFDLVKITENFYIFLTKQLHIENISFLRALVLLSLFYVVLGIFASFLGLITGRQAVKLKAGYVPEEPVELDKKDDVIHPDDKNRSLIMLFVHVFVIALLLWLAGTIPLRFSVIPVFVYVVFILTEYKRSLRYFKRPGFWLQIILFVIISALFYDGFNGGNYFSYEGTDAGLRMGLRAVLIVTGFSAISSELGNPLIKIMLYRKGFWQFYTALNLAFSVLPYLMKHSAGPKAILKSPGKTLVKSILDAEFIFEEFKKTRMSVKAVVISGEKHKGKTSFAGKVIEILSENNFTCYGFSAPGKFSKNERSEFYIVDLKSGKSELLCSNQSDTGEKKIGRFYFSEAGLLTGKEILKEENLQGADFVFIDEIGPFELRGKGWSDSVEYLLNNTDFNMVWTVRKNLVYDILRRFGITDAVIADIDKDSESDAAREIIKFYDKTPLIL